MLYQNVSVQPQYISLDGSDQGLLANLDFVETASEEQNESETISAQMELVRKGNRTAIAAVISSQVRILSQTKTISEMDNWLYDLDVEVINYNMAMKP